MEEHDLNRQLNRLIEGTIKAEDFTRLQEALRSDAAARQTYYDLLGVDLLLSEQFETRDYINVHSQAMVDSWAVRRARRGMVVWSLAAAAVLLLSFVAFTVFRDRSDGFILTSSGDSHFSINGQQRTEGPLVAGDSLELSHGVVSLKLPASIEVCLDGPSTLRVVDRKGTLELLQGTAFFEVAPSFKDFKVLTPAGTIHDRSGKFGVRVLENGRVEARVTSGGIEVERTGGEPRQHVGAGTVVAWSARDAIAPGRADGDPFVRSLPWDSLLFSDNFDEPNGTSVSGKASDEGEAWQVDSETNPTLIRRGTLDTSFGPRTLRAGFRGDPSGGRRRVYLTTFATSVPENIADKDTMAGASESLTLSDEDGKMLVSIVAHASDDHRWRLKDEHDGAFSRMVPVSALEAHTLTLSYDHESGWVRLYQGAGSRGKLLDEIKVRAGATPRSLVVSNTRGGDLAIDWLEVRSVTYPQESKWNN